MIIKVINNRSKHHQGSFTCTICCKTKLYIMQLLIGLHTESLNDTIFEELFAIASGPDYGLCKVDKCLGPTKLRGPTKVLKGPTKVSEDLFFFF